jgi:dienelactone hydrolase
VISARRKVADEERRAAFTPDTSSIAAYGASLEPYREQFRRLLGWPLTEEGAEPARLRRELVAEDDLGSVHRVWVETLPGLETYGVLLLPREAGSHPLVVCQHGGGGTSERCSGLNGASIYTNVPRRLLTRGCAVFAPQLPMWVTESGRQVDRFQIDRQLKQVGSSAAAMGIHGTMRSLDALAGLDCVDEQRLAMTGMSWGGFYTLVTAALDARIRVALSSCWFNDRYRYELPMAVWAGVAHKFMDAEIAALVCPRPLCIEVGALDDQFAVESARPEAEKVRATYEALGLAERFRYHEHPGGHEFDREDGGIEFVVEWLGR